MKPVICLMRTFPQYFKDHVFEVKHKLQFWAKNVEQTHHIKILLLLPEKKKKWKKTSQASVDHLSNFNSI